MNAASNSDSDRAETAQQAPPPATRCSAIATCHESAPRSVRAKRRLIWGFVFGIALGWCQGLGAQTQPAASVQVPPGTIAATVVLEPSGQTTTFTYFNRQIAVLRAQVVGRSPAERAAGAARILDDLVAQRIAGPVAAQAFEGGVLITVGSRAVIGLTTLDVDELAGETMDTVGARTVTRLQQALNEAVEARTPGVLLRAAALAVTGIAVGLLILWGLGRARRRMTGKLIAVSRKTMERSGLDVDTVRASHLLDFQRGLVTTVTVGLQLVVLYSIITFVFRRFPYTRPWGESLMGFLLGTVENLALGLVSAVPGLFTAAVIFLIAHFLMRVIRLWFDAVERGRIHVRWLYPETAVPTRRLLTTLLWLFATVVAYPYLPGSETDAFKGVTVFLGLIVTLGSSGLVNQVMSGLMLTYSRALRLGDFVRIGDVEGTVEHLGVLSTKVKTVWGEEATIPNALIVSQTTIDFSRFSDTEGVFTASSVTIGYDAPWRQVQSLLLLAAERTPGVRREPKPFVLQRALQDFYVNYTLYVCLERQELRYITLHALHANVQDLFNEYGVQIMSPNYVLDPKARKVVAKKDWFAAPAGPDPTPREP